MQYEVLLNPGAHLRGLAPTLRFRTRNGENPTPENIKRPSSTGNIGPPGQGAGESS